jgi:CheY-like chemotaxis protein
MATFSCKPTEKIVLPTLHAAVTVVQIGQGVVRLRVEAPADTPVLREAGRLPAPPARFLPQLAGRLATTAVGLGLLRLQLDAGLTEDARAALARVQEDFQLLRLGVQGEMEARRAPATRAPRKALLVEDDCNQRELLAGFLRHSGLQVYTAGDGSEALDYLGKHGSPDVVLLDMGLPRVDGPTTVREIRRNPAYGGLKIFGVTGRQPQDFDLERGPRGIDRWFHKPLDPAALVHDLAEELDGARCGV